MTTIAKALRELLHPQILQNGALELREDDDGSTCPPTKLERAGQAVALRFETQRLRPYKDRDEIQIPTNRWLFPLFNEQRSEPPVCRSCDYLVFYTLPGPAESLFVLLCELKSGRARGGGHSSATQRQAACRLHLVGDSAPRLGVEMAAADRVPRDHPGWKSALHQGHYESADPRDLP